MEQQQSCLKEFQIIQHSSRWWQIIDKYKVNTFYTAPTAIRALMREGDKPVKKTSRKSLKLLRNCWGAY